MNLVTLLLNFILLPAGFVRRGALLILLLFGRVVRGRRGGRRLVVARGLQNGKATVTYTVLPG